MLIFVLVFLFLRHPIVCRSMRQPFVRQLTFAGNRSVFDTLFINLIDAVAIYHKHICLLLPFPYHNMQKL